MTLKKPKKKYWIGKVSRPQETTMKYREAYNAAITEYDLWLTEAVKELREAHKDDDPDSLYQAVSNFIERIDHEN